ncbi:hypothetical protein U4P14_10475 [Klebsiella pneumoniae]|uniref:DUF7167 family protein n=1 Tax=Klebsiella pneumoniae TaxID=573 RepID=UPI002FE24ED3
MRHFRVVIETPFVGGEIIEDFAVDDDATEEEIAEEAKDIFLNSCNYSFHEITGEEE